MAAIPQRFVSHKGNRNYQTREVAPYESAFSTDQKRGCIYLFIYFSITIGTFRTQRYESEPDYPVPFSSAVSVVCSNVQERINE